MTKTIFIKIYNDLKKIRKIVYIAVLIYIPMVLAQVVQPLIIGLAVDQGFIAQKIDMVHWWASMYLLALLSYSIMQIIQLYLLQYSGQCLVRSLRAKTFAHSQYAPLSFFDKTPLGKVLTLVVNDTDIVAEMFASGAISVVGDCLFLVATLIMLFIVNVKLSLFSMLIMPVLLVGLILFKRLTKEAYIWVRSQISEMNVFLQEYLSGIITVQSSNAILRMHSSFDQNNSQFMQANKRAVFIDAAIYSFVDAINYITIAIVLWAGGFLHKNGWLEIGIMIAFLEAIARFFMPIRELSNKFISFQSGLVSAQKIYDFLNTTTENNYKQEKSTKIEMKQNISFKNVNFSYGSGVRVLDNISFTINAGKQVAIVGHTGSGKSTIAKLFTRLYDVDSGSICIDDKNIQQFNLPDLRNIFNVVPQEVFLFSGTLRENLSYGMGEIADGLIKESLQKCQAEYLLKRRDGLDAEVAPKGANFSLGERQLIALARALIANPQVLILDEATANIDKLTEQRLKIATKTVLQERTSIIIAHRLSTIKTSDWILVLHKGQLVEQGSHEYLISKKGHYSLLIEMQRKMEKWHIE